MKDNFKIGDEVEFTTAAGETFNFYGKTHIVGKGVHHNCFILRDFPAEYHTDWFNKVTSDIEEEEIKIDLGKHYKYFFKGIKVDVYRILEIFQITNSAQQHAIKKLLRAGKSIKPLKQDIEEVILTLQRWLEMQNEDATL